MKVDFKFLKKYLKNLIYPFFVTLFLSWYYRISLFSYLSLIYLVLFILAFSLTTYFTVRYVNNKKINYSLVKFNIPIVLIIFSLLMPINVIYYRYETVYVDEYKDLNRNSHNANAKYILRNDIDLSEAKVNRSSCYFNSFVGYLDCKGYKFLNSSAPLFTEVYNKSHIANLVIENVNIELNKDKLGAVCLVNNGIIENCYVSGNVNGGDFVGGICGVNNGVISLSGFKGNIVGNEYVGGISGESNSLIKRSVTSGVINGKKYIGSISGHLKKDLYDCQSNMELNGESGGLLCGKVSSYTHYYKYDNSNNYFEKVNSISDGIQEVTMPSRVVNSLFLGKCDYKTLEGDLNDYLLGGFFVDGTFNYEKVNGNNKYYYFMEDSKLKDDVEYLEDFLVSREEIHDLNWVFMNLNLNKEIWDYSKFEEGYLPRLHNKFGFFYKI